jgi:phage antirepressor YoqD-like protein/phage anti-repressor protein
MTNMLITPITDEASGDIRISGRQLHMVLDVKTRYNDWIPRMCEYGFSEGKDFYSKVSKTSEVGGRPSTDHLMTLSMAKEIAMLQRTDKGKEVRRYFIQLEEDWNTPEKVVARALVYSNRMLADARAQLTRATEQIALDAPKVRFAESVEGSKGCILIRELAKVLKQNGYDTGEKRLFETLRRDGYLIRSEGADHNTPTQRSMNMGLFVIKKRSISTPNGETIVQTTPTVTGKGQVYFVNRYCGVKA